MCTIMFVLSSAPQSFSFLNAFLPEHDLEAYLILCFSGFEVFYKK